MKKNGKEIYESPKVNIYLHECDDVLRTSDGTPLGDGDGITDTWAPII